MHDDERLPTKTYFLLGSVALTPSRNNRTDELLALLFASPTRKEDEMHFETATSRPTLPIFPWLVFPNLFLPFVIAIHPSRTWRYSGFLIICCISLKAMFTFSTGDGIDADNRMGVTFGMIIFNAIHLLLLSDPINDFRHEDDTVLPGDMPLLQRIYWAICLHISLRGIGWNYKLPHTPPSTNEPRWSFVRRRFARMLRYMIIIDAADSYVHLNPLFSLTGDAALPITAQGYGFRCLNIVAYFGQVFLRLQIWYNAMSALSVAIGLNKVKHCPSLFGQWRDAYTLRRFWGRIWHQNLRRFVSSIGKSIARNLGFKPGSNSSSYTQLYAGFILSGVLHVMGDAMMGMQFFGLSFPFFLAQAFAVTFEDAVIALARRAGISGPTFLTRFIG